MNNENARPFPLHMVGSVMEFSIYIKDDSAKDFGFRTGDYIKVRNSNSFRDGDYVVIYIHGEYRIKAYFTDSQGCRWLLSLNEGSIPLPLVEGTDMQVIGRVLKQTKFEPNLPCSECQKLLHRSQETKSLAPNPQVTESAIISISAMVKNGRQWYPVYRALCEKGAVVDGDYTGFSELVARVLPDHPRLPVASELRRQAIQSLRRAIGLWDRNDAPVVGKRFDDYLRIARATLELLSPKN